MMPRSLLRLFVLLLCLSVLVPDAGASSSSFLWDQLFHWGYSSRQTRPTESVRSVASWSIGNGTNDTTLSPSVAPPDYNHTNGTGTSPPTIAPAHNGTTLPPNPSNRTLAPTPQPHHNGTTEVPHNATTEAPTPSASNHTQPPSPAPSNHTWNQTAAPTPYHPGNHSSTQSPTAAPSDEVVPKMSFWKILSKTVAWLIFIGLSVLAFGGIMSHRYRIYFFLRGVWYTIIRMECTQWIFRKLRFGDHQVDSGLNTIIFDSEMSEGLLLNENRQDA